MTETAPTNHNARRRRDAARRASPEQSDAVTLRTGLTAAQRRQRSRIGALIRHSMGRTNTTAATNAFLKRFEDQVDPRRELSEPERQRRARAALRAHMARLALKSAKRRRPRR